MAHRRPAAKTGMPLLAMARMELRIGWRSTGFRIAALLAFLFGLAQGDTAGKGASLSAYGTAEAAWRYLGFVAIVWMALTAVRETTLRTDILISSKPQPSERLALVKFLGAFAQILLILLMLFLGAACGRLFFAGTLLGVEVYLYQYLRVAGILFFAASASYTLALLFDSPIAGALIGLYWVMLLAGKAFLAKIYFPSYIQNLPAYVALGVGLLCLTLWLYRRKRRGATPPALYTRLGAPLGLLVAVWLAWTVIRDSHDPQLRRHAIMENIGEQDATVGQRAPGFILPDQNGRPTGLSDFSGKILVIALVSPREPESIFLLNRLNEIHAKHGAQGVQPIAICLSEDNSAALTYARGEGLTYPVVMDWGTYNVPIKSEMSPLAGAYRADLIPRVIVTDRRRRVQDILFGTQSYDEEIIEQAVQKRLAVEAQ